MSLIRHNTVFAACEQQRRISDYSSTQFDQHIYFSLTKICIKKLDLVGRKPDFDVMFFVPRKNLGKANFQYFR